MLISRGENDPCQILRVTTPFPPLFPDILRKRGENIDKSREWRVHKRELQVLMIYIKCPGKDPQPFGVIKMMVMIL
jgi:hypothetical protein